MGARLPKYPHPLQPAFGPEVTTPEVGFLPGWFLHRPSLRLSQSTWAGSSSLPCRHHRRSHCCCRRHCHCHHRRRSHCCCHRHCHCHRHRRTGHPRGRRETQGPTGMHNLEGRAFLFVRANVTMDKQGLTLSRRSRCMLNLSNQYSAGPKCAGRTQRAA